MVDDSQKYLGTPAMVALAPVPAQRAPDNAPPPASSNAAPNPWAFSLTTSGYVVPGGESSVSPDFSANRGRLHLYRDVD